MGNHSQDGDASGESCNASRAVEGPTCQDEAYVKGRTIRKNETQAKLEAQRGRSYMKTQMSQQSQSRGCPSSMSRAPTSISSVAFDTRSGSAMSRMSNRSGSTAVSMTGSEYRATMDRLDELEGTLESERRARLSAERELAALKNPQGRSSAGSRR